MASFKESLNKTDKAFGVPLKGANWRIKKQVMTEEIQTSWKKSSLERMLIPSMIGITLLTAYPVSSYLVSRHSVDRLESIIPIRSDCEKGNCTAMGFRAALPESGREAFDELMNGEIKIVKKRNKKSGIIDWTNTRRLNERLQNMKISSFKASLDDSKKIELDRIASQEKAKTGSWFALIAFQLNALFSFITNKKGKGWGMAWGINASINAGELAANAAGTLGGVIMGVSLLLANIGVYVALKMKEKS